MIISSIVVKRIGLLFPGAGNGKRNRQQGYGRNIFQKIEMKKYKIDMIEYGSDKNTEYKIWKIEIKKIWPTMGQDFKHRNK